MSCTTCFSKRKGQFWHVGEAMCWVCRWLAWPAPAWVVPLIYAVFGGDSKEG
jgi:hypothetical protein